MSSTLWENFSALHQDSNQRPQKGFGLVSKPLRNIYIYIGKLTPCALNLPNDLSTRSGTRRQSDEHKVRFYSSNYGQTGSYNAEGAIIRMQNLLQICHFDLYANDFRTSLILYISVDRERFTRVHSTLEESEMSAEEILKAIHACVQLSVLICHLRNYSTNSNNSFHPQFT